MAKINTKVLIKTLYRYQGRPIYIGVNSQPYDDQRVTVCEFDIEVWGRQKLKDSLVNDKKTNALSEFDAEIELQIIEAKYNTHQFIDHFRESLEMYAYNSRKYYDNTDVLMFKPK